MKTILALFTLFFFAQHAYSQCNCHSGNYQDGYSDREVRVDSYPLTIVHDDGTEINIEVKYRGSMCHYWRQDEHHGDRTCAFEVDSDVAKTIVVKNFDRSRIIGLDKIEHNVIDYPYVDDFVEYIPPNWQAAIAFAQTNADEMSSNLDVEKWRNFDYLIKPLSITKDFIHLWGGTLLNILKSDGPNCNQVRNGEHGLPAWNGLPQLHENRIHNSLNQIVPIEVGTITFYELLAHWKYVDETGQQHRVERVIYPFQNIPYLDIVVPQIVSNHYFEEQGTFPNDHYIEYFQMSYYNGTKDWELMCSDSELGKLNVEFDGLYQELQEEIKEFNTLFENWYVEEYTYSRESGEDYYTAVEAEIRSLENTPNEDLYRGDSDLYFYFNLHDYKITGRTIMINSEDFNMFIPEQSNSRDTVQVNTLSSTHPELVPHYLKALAIGRVAEHNHIDWHTVAAWYRLYDQYYRKNLSDYTKNGQLIETDTLVRANGEKTLYIFDEQLAYVSIFCNPYGFNRFNYQVESQLEYVLYIYQEIEALIRQSESSFKAQIEFDPEDPEDYKEQMNDLDEKFQKLREKLFGGYDEFEDNLFLVLDDPDDILIFTDPKLENLFGRFNPNHLQTPIRSRSTNGRD